MKKSLLNLCEEYIINIYDTVHSDSTEYKLALASQRRDLHNLILKSLYIKRTDDILKITDNLDMLNVHGRPFDIFKKCTRTELLSAANNLKTKLEDYCEKEYPNRYDVVLVCLTDYYANLTKDKTYIGIKDKSDENCIIIKDDENNEYHVWEDIDIELDFKIV
jgi:hypothetical protein